VTRYLHGVYKDAVITDHAIMRNVHVCHQQAILTDNSFHFIGCAAADGHILPDHRVITDMVSVFSPANFKSCGIEETEAPGNILTFLPKSCAIPNNGSSTNPTVVINHNIFLNGCKRLNGTLLPILASGCTLANGNRLMSLCGK
jgi:hypothetical protein